MERFAHNTYGVLGIECPAPLCLPILHALESYVAQHLADLQFAALTFENHRGYVRGGVNPYSKWADSMLLYLLGLKDEVHFKQLQMRPPNYEAGQFGKLSLCV